MTSPFDQSAYQVRFDWGVAGLRRLAPSDVVIVVDVLQFSSALVDAVASAPVPAAVARTWSRDGADAADAAASLSPAPLVLVGALRNASAVAREVLAVQDERQRRTSVSVIAAGAADAAGGLRFAVEDQLGAGAVVAALSDLGIDHSSPEAAVAAESFRALRRATRHLLSGSGSGRELAAAEPATGREASAPTSITVRDAAQADASEVVPVLRGGSFERYA